MLSFLIDERTNQIEVKNCFEFSPLNLLCNTSVDDLLQNIHFIMLFIKNITPYYNNALHVIIFEKLVYILQMSDKYLK